MSVCDLDKDTCEEILELCIEDGQLEESDWPQVRDFILSRLEEIVHTLFPLPSNPSPTSQDTPTAKDSTVQSTQPEDLPSQISTTSQASNKENNAPASPHKPPNRPPVPPFTAPVASQASNPSYDPLPASILPTYNYIKDALHKQFVAHPPHTIQRLAELILRPRQHYSHLPAYLNALDRVVSVSSGPKDFTIEKRNAAGSLINGNSSNATSMLGSDESLGGALLTPIPWLRHGQSPLSDQDDQVPASASSTSTLSNGDLESSLREAGAVTQGELLRQEQEAGEVPVPVANLRQSDAAGFSGASEGDDVSEETPHARGPREVGVSDLGPQSHSVTGGSGSGHPLDIEAALGRSRRPETSSPPVEDKLGEEYVVVEKSDVPVPSVETGVAVDGDGAGEQTDPSDAATTQE